MFNQLLHRPCLSKTLSSAAVIASLGLTVSAAPASAASLTPVNVELSLLVDVSPSVGGREYERQRKGYQDAFIKLSSLFGADEFGSVAINLIQWSGADEQEQSIPWTLVNDQASALRFADTVGALVKPRGFSGTAPGSAIQFATPLFSSNDYEGQRWVIDVSGDAPENAGVSTRLARDNALAAGVSVINGLPIILTPSSSTLDVWYANNVQGGTGSFTIPAYGFEDVGRALEQKLRQELTLPPSEPPAESVPEPGTLLGIALVGGGFAYLKRRRLA